MDGDAPRLVLRADAVLDLVLGVVLLPASWDGLYRALDLPRARPEAFVQVGGVLLIAFSYLLWIAPEARLLTRRVAAAAAFANALAAVILFLWLVNGELRVGSLGTELLLLVAGALAVFAAAEAWIARRAEA